MYFGSKDAQIALFDELVSTYPNLIRKEIIGSSFLGKPIPMYRVGNPHGGKFLFDGAIHGGSDVSTVVHHLFLKWLLESYVRVVNGSVDPWEVRAYNIVHKKCLLCVPIFNIDRSTRKNANGGYWPNGVDLNRNFSYNWSSAGSSDPTNDNYRGTGPASEPETQNMKGVFAREVPEVYVNFHNWGGLVFRGSYLNTEQRTLEQQIANAYNTNRNLLGISDTVFSFGSGGPAAGYSSADAINTPGVKASFLVETCRMSTAEVNRPSGNTDYYYPPYEFVTDSFMLGSQLVSGFYPRVKPLLMAMAEAVSDATEAVRYRFVKWNDGDVNPTKTINL